MAPLGGWSPSLETGNEEIDIQHRKIIGFLDELKRVAWDSDSEVLRALVAVLDFTNDHFVLEEALMTRVNHPPEPTQTMVEQHKEFKSYARLRFGEFRRGEQLSVLPLHGYIEEFLTGHEFGTDRLPASWIHHQNWPPPGA